MTVAELVRLLKAQDQDATVYVFGENNGHEVHTEVVKSIVSGKWGPQAYIIISPDGAPLPA